MYPTNPSSADDQHSHEDPNTQNWSDASDDSLDETIDPHGDTNPDTAGSSLKHSEDWVGKTIARYKILRVARCGWHGDGV